MTEVKAAATAVGAGDSAGETQPLVGGGGYGAVNLRLSSADGGGSGGGGDPVLAGYIAQRSLTHYRIKKSSAIVWAVYSVLITVALAIVVSYALANRRDDLPEPVRINRYVMFV